MSRQCQLGGTWRLHAEGAELSRGGSKFSSIFGGNENLARIDAQAHAGLSSWHVAELESGDAARAKQSLPSYSRGADIDVGGVEPSTAMSVARERRSSMAKRI